MADKEEVMRLLEAQKDKYTDERVAKHFKTWSKTMQYHFTDINEYYVIELIKGEPQEIVQRKLENPDILYSMSTDTFVSMNKGEISGFKAWQRKLLKIKATPAETMKLQKLDKL